MDDQSYIPEACQGCLCVSCIHWPQIGCCAKHFDLRCPDSVGHDPEYICPDYVREECGCDDA